MDSMDFPPSHTQGGIVCIYMYVFVWIELVSLGAVYTYTYIWTAAMRIVANLSFVRTLLWAISQKNLTVPLNLYIFIGL